MAAHVEDDGVSVGPWRALAGRKFAGRRRWSVGVRRRRRFRGLFGVSMAAAISIDGAEVDEGATVKFLA